MAMSGSSSNSFDRFLGVIGLQVRQKDDKKANEKEKSSSYKAMLAIVLAIIGGFIVILGFSINACGIRQYVDFAGNGLLVAGASVMAGALLGFVFGIPRSSQPVEASEVEGEGAAQGGGNAANGAPNKYRPNTNLEQISDWLTKIIVGVGLTKLTVLPEKLEALADFLKPGFGSVSSPRVMAIAVVLYFSIAGFLFCYLWTRLYLMRALSEADIVTLGKRVSEIEKQAKKDATALSLVQKQLDPPKDAPEILEADLKDAIMQASLSVRTNIFYLAKEMREKHSKDEQKKMAPDKAKAAQEKMERTIPVFRALISSDTKDQFDRNHGELGFALMEREKTELNEAIKALTEAIRIRDKERKEGRLLYELKRGICRIILENEGKVPANEEAANRKLIETDLKAAYKNDALREIIGKEDIVQDWLTKHTIAL